jgi:hypothetical protein
MSVTTASNTLDTFLNNINYLFTNQWQCLKTSHKLRYVNSLAPLDEYVIDVTNESTINVSIPINDVTYKTTFRDIYTNDIMMNNAINYIKMHVRNYKA